MRNWITRLHSLIMTAGENIHIISESRTDRNAVVGQALLSLSYREIKGLIVNGT